MKDERQHIEEELESLAPGLARFRKSEAPLEAPPGYFDQLSGEVWKKWQAPEAPSVAGNPKRRQQWLPHWLAEFWRPGYAYALAGVALVVIGLSVFFRQDASDPSLSGMTLSAEEIESYIYANLDEFDLSLLAEESLPELPENEPVPEGDSLQETELDEYFDELLDEIELEELL